MWQLIFLSLIGGVFSLIGGFIILWKEKWTKSVMTPLLAFAAGAFLAASLLDILPEALEMTLESHAVFQATLFGFFIFFIFERFLMRYIAKNPEHAHGDHTESLPILIIIGDTLHNFLDGVAIGLSYIADPALGLTTTLAVAAHEIPQEIADFSVLLDQGWPKSRVIWANILQSLFTVPGAFIGYFAGRGIETSLPFFLALVGGIFLYLAASDIIPEIHHRSGHNYVYRVILPMAISILAVGYVIEITH